MSQTTTALPAIPAEIIELMARQAHDWTNNDPDLQPMDWDCAQMGLTREWMRKLAREELTAAWPEIGEIWRNHFASGS